MELELKPVMAEDVDRLRSFYGLRSNKTCDSTSLDNFLWKGYHHAQRVVNEGRTVLWLMEKDGQVSVAMLLYREEDLPYFFQQVMDYFSDVLYKPFYISLADGEVIQCLNPDPTPLKVEEQVDLKNYLYSGEELRKLEGGKFVKEKDHSNSFKRTHEGWYEYRHLCCSDRRGAQQSTERWRQHKEEVGATKLSPDYEVAGIHDMLKNCSSLYVRTAGVYTDGRLETFTIGNLNVREDMTVIHIKKASPEIRGLHQFINQQLLINELPGVELVNRENDTSMEGLRKAKMSYCPTGFVRRHVMKRR